MLRDPSDMAIGRCRFPLGRRGRGLRTDVLRKVGTKLVIYETQDEEACVVEGQFLVASDAFSMISLAIGELCGI